MEALNTDTDIVITMTESHRSPWFNMVKDKGKNGFIELLINNKTNKIVRRQDAPKSFDMTTVAYVSRPEYILRAKSIFEGTVRAVVIPPERAVDIDNPIDLEFAEFLLNRKTL